MKYENIITKLKIVGNITLKILTYIYMTYYLLVAVISFTKATKIFITTGTPIFSSVFYLILIAAIIFSYIKKFSYRSIIVVLMLINVLY